MAEGTSDYIVNAIHQQLHRHVDEEARGAPVIHGASIVLGGRRVILTGPKGAGKTTLVLRLLMAGASIEGDEHVVVRSHSVVARPRTLRVKESALALAPSLEKLITASPAVTTWDGRRIYSFEPKLDGSSWRIVEGPVEDVILIEPNHGGSSVLARLDPELCLREVLGHSLFSSGPRGLAVARLRRLILSCKTWRLGLGDLDHALWHLRRALM